MMYVGNRTVKSSSEDRINTLCVLCAPYGKLTSFLRSNDAVVLRDPNRTSALHATRIHTRTALFVPLDIQNILRPSLHYLSLPVASDIYTKIYSLIIVKSRIILPCVSSETVSGINEF
jgi:hypothetical protein